MIQKNKMTKIFWINSILELQFQVYVFSVHYDWCHFQTFYNISMFLKHHHQFVLLNLFLLLFPSGLPPLELSIWYVNVNLFTLLYYITICYMILSLHNITWFKMINNINWLWCISVLAKLDFNLIVFVCLIFSLKTQEILLILKMDIQYHIGLVFTFSLLLCQL